MRQIGAQSCTFRRLGNRYSVCDFVCPWNCTAKPRHKNAGREKRLMRRLAILAIVLGCSGSTAAMAATAQPAAERLKEAAFAANGAAADLDPIGGLLDRQSLSAGMTDWQARAATLGASDHAIDSLMIRQGSGLGPGE